MKTRVATFLGVLFLGVCPLLAAVDAFMKVDGIAGESTKPGRSGWIDVVGFSFGVPQTGPHGSGGGGGAGKVAVHDISITKKVDKASPMLMTAAATGKHFPTVTLDANGQHYVFENVVITSVLKQEGGASEVIKMKYVREAHDR
ncbi:MAG: type VI secretion system tube protein Hcp [Acidobacteriota bacterium]|nr:type VI secretion system tube protein Hcp [Acidobacteriota bacterium]